MAFLNEEFNVNELPQGNGNFEPLPAGWYTATISQSELKATKAGNGQYIKLRYDITGPSHQGRVVFGNLNIKNANPKAEEIGRQQLGDIMRAIGLAKVTDTDQLIGGQIAIKLMGFSQGVTVQGGLPVPITTPAHGTAYDIAGQGRAEANAMTHAFNIAARMGAASLNP